MIQRSTLCETKANSWPDPPEPEEPPQDRKLPVAMRTRRVNWPATGGRGKSVATCFRIVEHPEPTAAAFHRHHQVLHQGVGREGDETLPAEGVATAPPLPVTGDPRRDSISRIIDSYRQ